MQKEVIRAAWAAVAATAILAVLIIIGSRRLSHFDAALVPREIILFLRKPRLSLLPAPRLPPCDAEGVERIREALQQAGL